VSKVNEYNKKEKFSEEEEAIADLFYEISQEYID